MSTAIDTIRTEDRRTESSHERGPTLPPAAWITGERAELDVSDLPLDRVAAYARRAHNPVHLERKGGRTLLIA